MKRSWVDFGTDVDLQKMSRYGIVDPYFAANDPALTSGFDGVHYLDPVDAAVPGKPGIYFAWNWYPQMGAASLAELIHLKLIEIGWRGNPSVCIDIEKGHGLDDSNYVSYVVSFFKRWRQLRKTRETDWTLEGFQGGLFNNRYADVTALINAHIGIIPQFYEGDMDPHLAGVIQELVDYGFPRHRVHGFYDGLTLQEPWDGYVFTQNRLP